MDYRVQKILNMLRYKGISCTYNYLWYQMLYAHQGSLAKLLWTKLHPFFMHYPRLLEVEITTRCPLKCIICEHTYWQEEPRDMSFEQLKHIVDQFPKLKWIGLTGIGESFMNKDFIKMLEYVKSKRIYVELYDNFSFVDETAARALVKLSVDKIFISMDAATKTTYEKIRVGANFDKVLEHIKRLLAIRKERGTLYPELSFHYIINKLNIDEVISFVDLVYSLTGNESSIIFTRLLHYYPQVKDFIVDISQELITRVMDKSKETGVRIGWNADVPLQKPLASECSYWIMPFIFVTGDVIPCCAGNEANKRDLQRKYKMGNIFEADFMDIWNSENYNMLRQFIHKGKIPVQCQDCCVFDTKRNK